MMILSDNTYLKEKICLEFENSLENINSVDQL